MLLIHGDSDGWAAMNSVKVWEKMQRIWEFLTAKGYVNHNN